MTVAAHALSPNSTGNAMTTAASPRPLPDASSATAQDLAPAKASLTAGAASAASPALIAAFGQALQRERLIAGTADGPQALMRAAAKACRELLGQRWAQTQAADAARGPAAAVRRVHYLSMEFLMGRALGNALAALKLDDTLRAAFAAEGQSLPDVLERENDAALGNGGLGRLAACFLDSFAELGLPSFGYGLRYQYGMFKQSIQHGRQIEAPDDWMALGNAWEIPRPELRYPVGFGGRVEVQAHGARRWLPQEQLVAQAYDFIVPAHHSERVSTLRQWQAQALAPIDFAVFCQGEHAAAAAHRVQADAINWVLYPDDSTESGRLLRLKQEAFLVSASLQDLIARHLREFGSLDLLGRANAIHLNDTHPALAPAELMRLLLDEHAVGWDQAWAITRQAVSYTNHTLMPEALETWPVRMVEALLPRHLEIVYEINHRFLEEVKQRFPGDDDLLRRVSLIDEGQGQGDHGGHGGHGERRVRMAALSIVASHRVNGVAALHSDLMVQTIFADYARIFPERFHNVTNGVTPRRWLQQANPSLSALLDRRIGPAWRKDLDALADLRPLASDRAFGAELQAVKRENKQRLADRIQRELGVTVRVDSLFDVQIKRIHEYKRQLLNLLHVISRYQAIVANPQAGWVPRTVVIAGKAASAYVMAKSVIQLAHDVGRVINSDPRVGDRLKLVFLPNYGVSLAETIIPAADLSEQISTAGTEASGTGNMKFALNGALTIGTWDGANIEMAQAFGEANMFTFGLRTDEVEALKQQGYEPRHHVEKNPPLRAVIDAIARGDFSLGDSGRYRALIDKLLGEDVYLLMADFADYVKAQERVDALFRDPQAWAERVVLNIAGMGMFSSDRTIQDYVDRVWSVKSLG
ncbi:glycogen/starch/alpha-glucan phosphorylase [Roseateles amylovorans]|uniref:Alpha-1,4 glucan phosphorylase n=1 Tax=Roseateles amylovorans TaxID=2978473 RepID=A0ABY6AT04_9BURK|nr:glycogen/starch/alpha-glucan phosphorylase [Roseateles amylovorans]UXH76366.1 glycogen/starch/alpha-glucan phosphorylase [Roseateles amylovorans]